MQNKTLTSLPSTDSWCGATCFALEYIGYAELAKSGLEEAHDSGR